MIKGKKKIFHIGVECNTIIGENNCIHENGIIGLARYTFSSTILKGSVAEVEYRSISMVIQGKRTTRMLQEGTKELGQRVANMMS